MIPGRKFTEDSLFDGRLLCRQHSHGYRFSLDAVLLAHFIKPKAGDTILDLGTGCGVIPLILAYRCPHVKITALEVQPELADLARHNIEQNQFQDRIDLITGDYRELKEYVDAGSFSLVLSNPPYRRSESGRVNPISEEAFARHELNGSLDTVLAAAAYAVKTRGKVAVIYPASRGAALISEMKKKRMEPKRMQVVYSYPDGDGRLMLIEAVKGGGEELGILPPFYVYKEKNGGYSEDMARCYEP